MGKSEKHIITANEILSIFEERGRYLALANSYVKDFSTAEEIVQQCIFGLVQAKDSQYVYDPKAFFASSVRNRCLNYLKRRSRECSIDDGSGLKERIDLEIGWLESGAGTEESLTDFPELLKKAREQMHALTYDVFMAKRLDRMSYKEISRMFRISESRVHYEMHRAAGIFRKVFSDYGLLLLFSCMMLMSL